MRTVQNPPRPVKYLLIDLLLAAGIFACGACHGCACVVGAARGGMEGIRRDIAAAHTMTAPAAPAIAYDLPGQPPQGKAVPE